MPFVTGFLRLRRRGGHPDNSLPGVDGPVDPGYGIEGPVDPDYGIDEGGRPGHGLPPIGGGRPDNGLPKPPPGVWPPLTPEHPIQPVPPGVWVPPGAIWPPISGPVDPSYGIEAPASPDQGLPGGGGSPDQGLPGGPPRPGHGLPGPQKYWIVAGIPGVGWRYVCVDPSLVPTHPIAPGGPGAQPK